MNRSSEATAAQLPLALRFPADQRLDTLVAAPEGACAAVRALARGEMAGVAGSVPSALSALYLSGPAGTGKTHLLLAACAEAEAAGRRPAYLPLATAAGRLDEALSTLEHSDLIALDGLEAVAGRREDEVALFHAHNRARDAGRGLLYAARGAPDALALALPDLRSRLGQCVRFALDPLDDAGRGEVLRLRARRRGLQMDAAAVDWLLRRADRDLAGLTALLERLDRAALAAQRRITVPFLRQWMEGAHGE